MIFARLAKYWDISSATLPLQVLVFSWHFVYQPSALCISVPNVPRRKIRSNCGRWSAIKGIETLLAARVDRAQEEREGSMDSITCVWAFPHVSVGHLFLFPGWYDVDHPWKVRWIDHTARWVVLICHWIGCTMLHRRNWQLPYKLVMPCHRWIKSAYNQINPWTKYRGLWLLPLAISRIVQHVRQTAPSS